MSSATNALTQTRQLATFGAGLSVEDLPSDVLHEAKRSLLDWICAALAGADEPAAVRLRRVVADVAKGPDASILGVPLRASAPFAALANGYASHLQDFDDVFNPEQTTVHLSSCVWPVVLALGEIRPLSGAAALASYVAGFETGARVGRAAGISHYESSWQVTGTAGHLAGAAAGARALGLSGENAAHALGIAAAQASGIREIYGSDTKALQPAKAAMDGVLGALLAEQGFSSRDTALEGERGLLRVISLDPDTRFLTVDLGTFWNLRENGHKLYPSASLTHPAVDAAIMMHGRPGFDPGQLVNVEARMLPFAAEVTALVHPSPGSDARFSAPHCLAVALNLGRLGLRDFTAESVADPRISGLRDRIKVVGDPLVGKQGATLHALLTDGTRISEQVEHNRGTPENRISDAELEQKFIAVAEPRFGIQAARAVIDCCWDLEFLAHVTEVIKPLQAPAQ
jgi:2-methylcitrate dehydratase PrpD